MCIAGHNYNNYQFFSRLKKLNVGDSIYIYDLSGNKQEYVVYKNYETDASDVSCTSQNTNGKREITLITCNNIKTQRRIVKAREKE
jgi:LPXTG-site transpeptidase (sortase) family protein